MTYTFTRTREQMRDMIARKLGVKEQGQSLSAEDAYIIYEGIDLRLKELHSLGILWWNVSTTESSLTLVAGTETVSLSSLTDFLYPVSAVFIKGSDRDPIEIVDQTTFASFPDRTTTGQPVSAMFANGYAYFNPVPEAAGTVKITYQAIASDSAANTAPDVSVAGMRAFADIVAYDLALDFEVPAQVYATLQGRASDAMRTLKTINHQKVAAVTIQPEWF